MKGMIDVLSGVVGVAALAYAIYQFYLFATYADPQGGHNHLWQAIIAAVVACICILAIFLRRVNKEEEIHITQ